MDRRKLHVRIVVPKLQSLILRVTRRVALMVHCIVANVPFSPQNYKMIWIIILLRAQAPKPDITFKCKLCYAEFPGFYALRQRKNTQHGPQMGYGASNIDVEDIVGDVDDHSLREELEFCKHFLTDTEMENGRHRVFNFAMSSFDLSLLNDKLDYVFKELKCAAKLNLHLDSFWKTLNMECVDTFTLTTTIILWRGRNLCVHKLIWLTWKTECRKRILLIFVPENERIRSGNFTDLQVSQFFFVTQRFTHGL